MDPIEFLKDVLEYSLKSGGEQGEHITRFYTYNHLRGIFSEYDDPQKKALSISGSQHLAKVSGIRSANLFDAAYPEYDVQDLPFKEESFDFIFSDQVLEHVQGDIAKVYRHLAKLLKPGGRMIHVTPFLVDIHPTPKDCWRFAPDGLMWLAEQAGLVIEQCDGWGNRLVWAYILLGFRFHGVPKDPNHPINKLATFKDKNWPINIWLVCRKPDL